MANKSVGRHAKKSSVNGGSKVRVGSSWNSEPAKDVEAQPTQELPVDDAKGKKSSAARSSKDAKGTKDATSAKDAKSARAADKTRRLDDIRAEKDAKAGKKDEPATKTEKLDDDKSGKGAHGDENARSASKSKKKRKVPFVVKFIIGVIVLALLAGLAFAMYLDRELSLGDASADTKAALSGIQSGEPFYVLVLGSDSREGSGTSQRADMQGDQERSDVMILARVDTKNSLLTLLTIPRDTPVTLDDGSIAKINECYNRGGPAYSIRKVSELTGVPIHHYVELRFSNLEEVIDSLGGVDVDVPMDMGATDALTGEWVSLSAGKQRINGQQAQILARARHQYGTDQDANRQNTVRALSVAILKRIVDRPVYEIPQAVLTAAKFVGTDIRTTDLIPLASALGKLDNATVYTGTGPYAGDNRWDLDGLWLCYENPTGWKAVMDVVDSGGDPSTVDVNAGAIIP